MWVHHLTCTRFSSIWNYNPETFNTTRCLSLASFTSLFFCIPCNSMTSPLWAATPYLLLHSLKEMSSLWQLAEFGLATFSWTWSPSKKKKSFSYCLSLELDPYFTASFFSFFRKPCPIWICISSHSSELKWLPHRPWPRVGKKQRQHSTAVWVGVLTATGHAPLHRFAPWSSKTERWVRRTSWMVTISLRNELWLSGQQNALQCTQSMWNPPSERFTCIWVMP